MISPQEFRRIVSGERTDLPARLLRPILALASIPYGIVVRRRNANYSRGKSPQFEVDVPVICVGNLTVGGTGKTPMVAFLCRWFRERDVRVAIVSRGYRADEGKQNDEARELSERLPDVPHIQNPDRVAAVTVAADELEMELVVLDDGFQHRRLVRDLDFVLLDALEPFGFDWLLPRGLLREPVEGLGRAGVVALTRANLVSHEERQRLRDHVSRLSPNAVWVELAHSPTWLVAGERRESVDAIRGKRVLGFCGLGNPKGFRCTLEECGASIEEFIEFPDHHEYTREDLDRLRDLVRHSKVDFVVCTQKDMVKIELDQLELTPLRALQVEQQILNGESELNVRLDQIRGQIVERRAEREDF